MSDAQEAVVASADDLALLGGLPASGEWLSELGLVLDEASPTRVAGHIDLGDRHHTPWGVVHGGVYTTIVETAASIGASLAAAPSGQFSVGVNNSTDFLRATTSGTVHILAQPVVQGRVQQLWEVSISRPDDGKLVASGRVRLQNVPLPSGGS
jgi:uncharacterized protein (TIGR00369 family)